MKHQFIWLKILTLSVLLAFSGCATVVTSNANNLAIDSSGVLILQTSRMMSHLNAFQDIAKQNGGNRAVGTKGGAASGQYIFDQAKKTPFTIQAFPFENRDKVIGQNIIVEIAGQSKDKAIILGAHYDSVKMGPGINDNASGTALLLNLVEQMAAQNIQLEHTIYVAFWDSEETGIAGSSEFVKHLLAEQLTGIKAYINVDMVGTKNPEILIADADKSSIDDMEKMLKQRGMAINDYQALLDSLRKIPSHTGDLALENTLKDFFRAKNLNIKEDVATLTASDTAAFLGKVPVSSIILFNEQMKGDVLEFAPCYHSACDTIDQVDPESLEIAAEAVLYLLKTLDRQ